MRGILEMELRIVTGREIHWEMMAHMEKEDTAIHIK